MSKEIYKEYVNKYFFECESEKDRIEVNRQYLYCYGEFSGSFDIHHSAHPYAFVDLHNSEYECVKRKPKTQMINGYEVVAPRYDFDFTAEIFILDPIEESGVFQRAERCLTPVAKENLKLNGWFYNKTDAIAYANAHRENKSD